MDTPLQIHKRKVYTTTAIGLIFLVLLISSLLFLLGGLIFHTEFCLLNTRIEFLHYKNLQSRLKYGLQDQGWQPIRLQSRFGYELIGTFILNPRPSNKTIIFLHGISATQAMGMHYVEMYLNEGYNLLIYDSRSHGASSGACTTWGYYEKYDLDQWIDWLLERNPQSTIGVHGVSMGAATALMHTALNEPSKRVKFYIADSPYSDLTKLITQKIITYTQSQYPLWIHILVKCASLVSYFQSDFLYEEVSPIKNLTNVTTPILYLHSEADVIVPVEMSRELYEATNGYRELHTFPNIKHGRAAIDRKSEYQDIVVKFLHIVDE
ncbi:alpha/beta hydrolase [Sporomusa malonica]|nr:alpha/beta fold hydrolase [Sporomusa malonica]